jgi:hypothetical protein
MIIGAVVIAPDKAQSELHRIVLGQHLLQTTYKNLKK